MGVGRNFRPTALLARLIEDQPPKGQDARSPGPSLPPLYPQKVRRRRILKEAPRKRCFLCCFLFCDTTEVEGGSDSFLKFLSRERLPMGLSPSIEAFSLPDPNGLGLISRYVEIVKLSSKFPLGAHYTPCRAFALVFRRGFRTTDGTWCCCHYI